MSQSCIWNEWKSHGSYTSVSKLTSQISLGREKLIHTQGSSLGANDFSHLADELRDISWLDLNWKIEMAYTRVPRTSNANWGVENGGIADQETMDTCYDSE